MQRIGTTGTKLTVVRAVPRSQGMALQYASEEHIGNRDVVLTAIRESAHALAAAAPDLQHDSELVMAAVTQIGLALEHAAPECQGTEAVQ
eukprot:4008003-Amphidinium_carterae.2